ncbi:zinc-ribbon domain-containing protein [Streptomyces sp. NPDC017988]|uniref:zinc-ribbon domain-containing protein n=1 Tax=Streptomyces sp. NPDC017988 TaxID=3365025 RepID=UPI003797AD76
MASYCPHCGASAPDEARFCMKCGKERLPDPPVPDTPPAPAQAPSEPRPPASPPPPVYTPAPAPAATAPSPVGAFFGRTFRGDWAGAAQAALWPFALLLIGGLSLAIPSYGQGDEPVAGFTDRLRIALALLLQSVGGGFDVTGHEQRRPSFGDSNGFGTGSDGLGSDGMGSGGLGSGGLGSDSSAATLEGTASLHIVPLTVTALWIVALLIGVRVLRNRLLARGYGHQGGGTAGLEAAVRVSLLATAGVLALSLFAQPEIEGVELSSSPVLAALGALGIALVVSYGVLHRVDPLQVAARPGVQSAFRAVGTALRALAVVLVLCAVVAFISLAQVDDLAEVFDLDDDGVSPLLVALLILPNLAVAALGISWGAGAEASVRGSGSLYGGRSESETFGLSELGDVTNDWAIVGALALGLVCALTLGVLAARRCASRGEQLLCAGVSFGLVLLLAAAGGLGVEASGAVTGESGFGGAGGNGGMEIGLSVPEVLLFGLLWIFPAALLGPYLLRMAGQSGAPAAPAYAPVVPPIPGAPAGTSASEAAALVTHSAPTGPATPPAPGTPAPGTPVHMYGPHAVQPAPQPPAAAKPRGRAGVWVATLAGAFLIGGGATAGVLVWQDNHDDKTAKEEKADKAATVGKDDKPSASEEPSQEPGPSAAPTTPSPEKSDGTDPGAADEDGTEVPEGSERVTDSEGFSFAVPEGWTRQSVDPERPGQITYAGSTGREEFLVGVVRDAPYTSYENFTNIEKHTKSAPDKSDYQRIRMERNTFQGQDGAIWEYTYTDEADRTIHAVNQSYIAEDGTEYAIQLSWRENFWPAGEGAKTHRTALKTWRLTG